MRKPLLAALPLAALALCASAQSNPVAAFRYRAARVPAPGTVIHYVKSNLDGSKPSLVSVYFAGPDDIEVSKSERGGTDATDVKAHLDWKRFTADKLDAGVLTRAGVRESRGTLVVGRDAMTVRVGEVEQSMTVTTFPLHVYNFDLMGLNAVLPQLRAPQGDFTVAFAEPTFGDKPGVIEFRGRARASYLGDETLHGRLTHRYRVSGPGFADSVGLLWIDAQDGLIDLFESPLPNNPDWDSYRLERRGPKETMTRAQWDAYKLAGIGVGVGSMQ
jgi:hypothetical protein